MAKIYNSFLIRYWLTPNHMAGPQALLDIEHIQTGEHTRITNPVEAAQVMTDACRAAPHASISPRAGEDETECSSSGRAHARTK
jgi:hypothetical protein